MVLPLPVDLNVAPCQPLLAKAHLCQEISRGVVGRQAGGFYPVQAQRPEDKWDEPVKGVEHVALAGESFAHPVAETAGLRDAAADIGERAAAEQCVVGGAEDEKRIGGIETGFTLVALQA